MKIVLASNSPRRKELLSLFGIEFDIMGADIDETVDTSLSISDEISRLSYEKAKNVALRVGCGPVIISADTVVVWQDKIIGKPKDCEDAFKILKGLSGNTHKVMTAFTVMQGDRTDTRVVTTDVTFREIDDQEILSYIKTGEPMDKAGAYGIQGIASKFVSHINGDYFNVVGLPICELCNSLKKFNINL